MTTIAPTAAQAPRPARTADLFAPRFRGLTLGLVSSITLVALESLAIGTVMPLVADELGDLQLYGWVFSAFFLGNLIGIVVVGGALDRMPLRRPFAIGLSLFAVGLAIGGLASSMPVLVAARFVQGLGGGAIPPTAYVAIGRSLPESLRPRMFAMLSTAWVVPGVIGPSLAAVVGELLHWRIVFLGLLPFLAVAGLLAVGALRDVPDAPEASGEPAAARATLGRLPNALLVALGAGILLAALTVSEPLLVAGGTIAGLVLLVPGFRRLTPPGTLGMRDGVPAAILLRGVLTFAFFAGDAYIPLLLQTWRETPPTLTGLVFTATTLSWTAGTWLQARRVDRWGTRRFAAIGFAAVALGTAITMPALVPGVPPEISIVTWSLVGIGMGLAYSTFTLIVLREAAPAEQGADSAALQLSDILGTALGAGAGGAIIAIGERSGGDGLGMALGAVFGLAVVLALAGLAGTRRLHGHPAPRNHAAAAVD